MDGIPFQTYFKRLTLKSKFSMAFSAILLVTCAILSILVFEATQGILISDSETFSMNAVQTDIALLNNVKTNNNSVSQIFSSIKLLNNSGLALYDNGLLYIKGNLPHQDLADSISQYSAQQRLNYFVNINGSYYVVSKETFKTNVYGNQVTDYIIQLNSFNTLHEALNILALLLVAFSIFFTFLGLLVFQFYFNRFQKRLGKITVTAARISQGTDTEVLEAKTGDELDEIARQLNQVSTLLKEKLDEEQRFAADVSHELRSPLHTLAATSGVLMNHADEMNPNAQKAVKMLNAEIERLSKLVIDLLEIFRVDSQLTESDLQPVSIFKLIQESLKAAGCEIEVTCNDLYSHILVNADKKRFERVVANIVYNAQTYADGLKSVTISKLVDTVIIYFDDDGPGIDRAHRNQVFERFNRGVRSGSRGLEKGTGLGLALVAKIVSGHKGKVSIDSSLSGGARIIIELPIFIPKS